ncbi:MAG: hypothetical protein DHS20C18_02330 [Saprospiraceae bacterium]|nr:MAG: hypothetical protein DHS20C18_02330 [Saprospiraceae bacterium]
MRISSMFSIVLLAFLFTTTSCKKEETCNCIEDTDYLLFGHFYGECMGESCIEIFKLTDEALFEDTVDQYPSSQSGYEGNFVPLDHATFTQVADLINQVPDALFNETEVVIGMPDAGDWGGFYVEVHRDGNVRFWLIDTMRGNIPEYLHDFTTAIENAIVAIND